MITEALVKINGAGPAYRLPGQRCATPVKTQGHDPHRACTRLLAWARARGWFRATRLADPAAAHLSGVLGYPEFFTEPTTGRRDGW
jgi:hypothetical protein